MKQNITLVEYSDNFAENITAYAYAKIIENNSKNICFWENNPTKRQKYENLMSDFNLKNNYICTTKANKICKKALDLNIFYINNANKYKNKIIKPRYFNLKHKKFLTKSIIDSLNFKNINFVSNHDILEEILNTNSIGLYINPIDIKDNKLDFDFIKMSIKRLNKYIKQPKLFIFINEKTDFKIESDVEYQIINLTNFKEEFQLLKSCKHKIILNTPNSYLQGFWASVINENESYLITYDKKLKNKNLKRNWIAI